MILQGVCWTWDDPTVQYSTKPSYPLLLLAARVSNMRNKTQTFRICCPILYHHMVQVKYQALS